MSLLKSLKSLRHEAYLAYCRMLPIQRNKVILWADDFKSFGCSPKYIALELAKRGNCDVVWVLDRDRTAEIPAGIRVVPYFSMEYLREIATAKVIVCNHRTSDYHFFRKRRGQFYIQTWHSSLRLKKIEGDAPSLPEDYVNHAKVDSAKIDLLLSGCAFSSDIFRRAFWYDGPLLEAGTPRCDGFFENNSAVKQKVFSHYSLENGKKFALYAPTFRKDMTADLYGMDFSRLQQALGPDWVIGCRLHPNLNADVPEEGCVSMSRYPDMQELLAACDLLITDYSSSMFDMAVAGKKCALYVPDLEDYTARERGLYFDIESLPFPMAKDMDELCALAAQGFDCNYSEFLKEIGSFETGSAAKAAADRIESVCFHD